MAGGSAADVLDVVERAVTARIGIVPARASVSFVGVDPIELLRFTGIDATTILTRGMARAPMGESNVRAELIVTLHGDGGQLWRQLAVLAAAPVVEGVVYSLGQTVDLATPIDAASLCTGGVITASEFDAINAGNRAVTLLQFIPATASELAFSRARGSRALQQRWQAAGTDLLDLGRASVDLSG